MDPTSFRVMKESHYAGSVTKKVEPEQPPRRVVPKCLNEQHASFWPKRTRLPFPVVDQDGKVIEPGTLVVVSSGKVWLR